MPGLERIDRAALERFPNLGLVALPATGWDSVDLKAAEDLGIMVTNVPSQATEEVATHALALILALLRNVPMHDRNMRAGQWQSPAGIVTPTRTSTMTLGIVGVGKIGGELARIATPIFGKVAGYDPYLAPTQGNRSDVELVDSIDMLARRCDVMSLHVPLTHETAALLADIDFADSPVRYLINVSRGGLIAHDVLLELLEKGVLDGVGLDAFAPEPPHHDDALLQHPRVISTPHRAFESVQAWDAYGHYPIQNAIAHINGAELVSPVPAQKGRP